MTKKHKLDNLLIKANLIKLMKKEGIFRVKKEAINEIQRETLSFIKRILKLSYEELRITGSKTLKKENVANSANKLKKEEEFFEV